MYELIVAVDQNWGIGFEKKLPWNVTEEMEIFTNKTVNRIVVIGTKTAFGIPKLKNRKIICVTKNNDLLKSEPYTPDTNKYMTYVDCIEKCPEGSIIAGGAQIYELAFKSNKIDTVHLSIMKQKYSCDTFFDREWLDSFVITESAEHDEFTHYVLKKTCNGEEQYIKLVKNIIRNGKFTIGRNGQTISIFKNDMTFDMRNGFPLLTTKKMFLRGIVEEFLFFLRGDTDTSFLSERKVRIWEGNTTEEFIQARGLKYAKGVMGPMYGYQWRSFGAPYNIDESGRPIPPVGGIDQLSHVVNTIKTCPQSRRILMTSYNPSQLDEGVLEPCHSISIQFNVEGKYLDMFCFNRSQDVALGVPFNIASSSLLLMVVASMTDKTPRFLHMTMGNTHIYTEHLGGLSQQVERIPYKFPSLTIPKISLDQINNIAAEEFKLS